MFWFLAMPDQYEEGVREKSVYSNNENLFLPRLAGSSMGQDFYLRR